MKIVTEGFVAKDLLNTGLQGEGTSWTVLGEQYLRWTERPTDKPCSNVGCGVSDERVTPFSCSLRVPDVFP